MENIDAKIIDRIKKLLALANNNPNENEAAVAMAKATELLEAYNLDMASVGGTTDHARNDKKRKGGLYSWQRNLWRAVAELNFCHYFSLKGLARGSQYEHRLIGSHANVIATEMMATYLQDTVEKLAQKWAKESGYGSVFVREAIAYREGMTNRLAERLAARREELVSKARQEAEERKRNQARAEVVTGNELTILDVISSEADFNNDYLNGWEMGTTARNRAKREAESAAWRAKYEADQAARKKWEEENPVAAAREREKAAAEYEEWLNSLPKAKRRRQTKEPQIRYRKATPEEERMSLGSYRAGRARGNDVGIDTQVGGTVTGRLK